VFAETLLLHHKTPTMSKKRNPTANNKSATTAREPGLAEEQAAEAEFEAEEVSAPPPRPRPRAALPPAAAQGADSLPRSLMCCVLVLVVGFWVAFSLANKMRLDPRPQGVAAGTTRDGDGSPPPLDPSQTTGELPPGHPDIGAAGGQSAPAASDADAQQAM